MWCLGKHIFKHWNGNFTGIVKSLDSVKALSLDINASHEMPINLDSQSVVFATNGSPNQLEQLTVLLLQIPTSLVKPY